MKKMLIAIPARDEAASLAQFLPRLKKTAKELGPAVTIVVVDDGSKDETVAVAEQCGCEVIRHPENKGLGHSLRAGYKKGVDGGYDWIATLDADGQHDERFLGEVVSSLFEGADVVIASRYHPKSERRGVPFDRDLLNIAVAAQMRVVTGWNLTDPLSGFWGMQLGVAKFLLEQGRLERYGSCLEHLIKLWYYLDPRPAIVEIPHPAIYAGDEELATTYAPDNQERRLERFGTHALHIVEAMKDVRRRLGDMVVNADLARRRWR